MTINVIVVLILFSDFICSILHNSGPSLSQIAMALEHGFEILQAKDIPNSKVRIWLFLYEERERKM